MTDCTCKLRANVIFLPFAFILIFHPGGEKGTKTEREGVRSQSPSHLKTTRHNRLQHRPGTKGIRWVGSPKGSQLPESQTGRRLNEV
ncbi:mCG148170 [Mus musculus]|nr:mCG148170 [Mus musculus]